MNKDELLEFGNPLSEIGRDANQEIEKGVVSFSSMSAAELGTFSISASRASQRACIGALRCLSF